MAGGHHQIIAANLNPFGSRRHERQQVTIVPADAGQAIQPGSDDPAVLDDRRHAARHVHHGIEIRLREDLAERLEHLLAAAHASEPVMYQRTFHDVSLNLLIRKLICRARDRRFPYGGTVGFQGFSCGPLPRKAAGSQQTGLHQLLPQACVSKHGAGCICDLFRVLRIHKYCSVSGHLGQGGIVATDNRAATGHGFEYG